MFNKVYIEKLQKKQTFISCSSIAQKKTILLLLQELGYKIYEDSLRSGSLYIKWSNFDRFTGHGSAMDGATVPFEEVITKIFVADTVEIQLNSEYKATYEQGSSFVRVGCQKIEVKQLDELVKAINTLNNNE
jgi:hypothetical protein